MLGAFTLIFQVQSKHVIREVKSEADKNRRFGARYFKVVLFLFTSCNGPWAIKMLYIRPLPVFKDGILDF